MVPVVFRGGAPKRVGICSKGVIKWDPFQIGSMGLVYLPTFYHKNQPNVGKYMFWGRSNSFMLALVWDNCVGMSLCKSE